MANANRDTRDILLECGAKERFAAPKKWSKNYVTVVEDWTTEKHLILVIDTPYGDYLKRMCYSFELDQIHPMMSVRWFEVSKKVWERVEKHPKYSEIIG